MFDSQYQSVSEIVALQSEEDGHWCKIFHIEVEKIPQQTDT
jgi:hypothetical protein